MSDHDMSPSPFFIIGNPRSGTTMFRLMMTSHPRLVVPPECGFALWWYDKWKNFGTAPEVSISALEAFTEDLFLSKKFETWGLEREPLLAHLIEASPPSYARLVSAIYEWYARSEGRPGFSRWGDKNNFHIDHIETIGVLFPRATFLHIVRDGRDVACSYKALAARQIDSPYAPRLPAEIGAIAAEWAANVEKANAAFDRVGRERIAEVRFPDLVSNPEKELRRLCQHIDEKYHPDMARFNELNREKQLEPKALMQWKIKTLRKPMPTEIGRYRKELTSEEVAEFNSVARVSLERYGYL